MRTLSSQRERAALTLLQRHGLTFHRIARRISLCPADADDALQRAVIILLTKAPPIDRDRLAAWMAVVTKREALAVRRARERILGRELPVTEAPLDAPELVSDRADPVECFERSERLAEARRALAELRRDERLALLLQAHGYSYAEICERLGWTYTKLNRCLAEGRARLRLQRSLGER